MELTTQQTGFSNRLVAQLESLQGGFRKLSKAATINDLAEQFAVVLGQIFTGLDIDLFQKPNGSDQWRPIRQVRQESLMHLTSIPQGQSSLIDTPSSTFAVVQRLVDGSNVGMVLTQQNPAAAFSDIDTLSFRMFLQLFDTAYQSLHHRGKEKDLIFALNHRVLQLNSLIDTGIEVSTLDEGVAPQRLALERAASLTNASHGAVTVMGESGLKEETFFPDGIRPVDAVGNGHRITSFFEFKKDKYTFELFEKESRSGIVLFDETDQLLLNALARQVHASLENRHLHQQALEKQKIERDISVAASIQQRLLPETLPSIEGYDIAGINIPSKFVGGDYYDCIPLPEGRYALVIADVAGKGIPAALLVSSLHAYLSAYLETTMSLVELAVRLNKVICRASTDDKFITAFICILTPQTGEIEAVNAGHNPVYILRNNGEIQEIKAEGIPFGMLDLGLPYKNEWVTLGKGERLLLYTDGIPEAINEEGVLYESVVPLQDFLKNRRSDPATTFIKNMIDDIKKFTGNAPQSDDITALYLVRQ